MKDQFEKYINEHREEFDDLRAGEHLWEGIESSLEDDQKKTNWPTILWRAAAVALIFTVSFFTNEAWHQYRNADQTSAEQNQRIQEIEIPELLEAEAYYTSKFEERMEEMQTYSTQYPEIEKELKVEMAELDKAFEELKTDLKDDIDNDEIVEAMIQNYRIKVRMLEEILSQLKTQESNSEEDENNQYEI